jgi:phosphoglucomutase
MTVAGDGACSNLATASGAIRPNPTTPDPMTLHPLAGQPVPADRVPDIETLLARFHEPVSDPGDAAQRVSFGTSGHRGSSLDTSFNEGHIAAISQAVAEHRREAGITGPLFLGRDTHALSEPALETALEVLAANDVQLMLDDNSPYTPTPVLSWAILQHNHGTASDLADGVIITPSHNPPEDGGLKYNPPTGGPADAETTAAIETRANDLLLDGLRGVKRVPVKEALASPATHRRALRDEYVADLEAVIDLAAIRDAGVRIGVDPLGGASVGYWEAIAERHGLDIEVVNPEVDPAFAFMHLDWDGKIRMDCSSPHAMSGLIGMKDRFDVAVGLDPDADRHGIVTPSAGLLNPNHYLAAAVDYLFRNRPWGEGAAVGKTVVSSSMIDRVAADLGRELVEVPVGFKWFVEGLQSGRIAFGGEESAGASFLRRDGSVWTTDKDGILLCLLAAEMTARTGRDPGELYAQLEGRFGRSSYERIDAPASREQKAVLKALSPDAVTADRLAGEEILARLTRAPGNDAPIGGLKVVTENGWFAARPSGTEDVYKIYAESFRGADHLRQIQDDAREIVDAAFRVAGA